MDKRQKDGGFWLGIDVAKQTFDASLACLDAVPSQWSKLPVSRFSMSMSGVADLLAWLQARVPLGECRGVCLESTGVYSQRLVAMLRTQDLPVVSMVNPALPVAFRKSFALHDKCDRVDAAVLALFGVVHQPLANCVDTPLYQRLRQLRRLHEDFTDDIRRWENRLEQCDEPALRRAIQGTLRHLKTKADKVWKQIEQWVQDHDELHRDVELITTIPGIAAKTAIAVLAEAGDLRQWKPNQLVSYAGLFPKVHSSGTSVARKPRLHGGGHKRLRTGLFLPACPAARHHPQFSQWRLQLLERGKAKKAVIAAIMRKLLLLIRSVVVHQRPYDPHFKAKIPA
ncbi:MAG: IS110 family transposase [Candidatus Hydrogenedens sp.]|nr:IS110 family transposase [Candidatus Hydrogenedens sp.]